MGLQSTGVATTGSLPTEGVPLVEQLRRVGRDDEGGRGGVCGKKEKPREKNAAKRKILSPTAACNVETLPPSLSLPYLSSSGFFFFYLCLSPQPLVLTPHSAHKAKKKYSGGENLSFDHCITRRSPYTSVRTLLLSSLARICAAHFLTGAVGFPDSLGHVTVLARHRLRRL